MATTLLSDDLFTFLDNPTADHIPNTVEAFLAQLTGPTHIKISGRDSSRCRVLVTLIHGNEPSGLYATYKFLQNNIQPAVDLHVLLPSVKAAKAKPEFSHRMLPDHHDLNRCFKAPFSDQTESQLANKVLQLLEELAPEAVIDLHNTSGSGPAFGVSIQNDSVHKALVSYFTDKLVITDLSLGALMEATELNRPIVTIECGGSKDHESHALAYHGLLHFADAEKVLEPMPHSPGIEMYLHPMRVELEKGRSLEFDDQVVADKDLTLVNHIEDFNFGLVDESTCLGYFKSEQLNILSAKDNRNIEAIDRYFQLLNGELRPKQPLKMFMITTNINIACSDCLFYFVAMSN